MLEEAGVGVGAPALSFRCAPRNHGQWWGRGWLFGVAVRAGGGWQGSGECALSTGVRSEVSKVCSNGGVGENKRYGSSLTRGAVNEFLVRPRPISLSRDELDGQDVVDVAAGGDVVNAWVRYPEVPVQVTGRVVAFTDRAVQIEYQQRDGATHRVWVWSGAVTWPTPRS